MNVSILYNIQCSRSFMRETGKEQNPQRYATCKGTSLCIRWLCLARRGCSHQRQRGDQRIEHRAPRKVRSAPRKGRCCSAFEVHARDTCRPQHARFHNRRGNKRRPHARQPPHPPIPARMPRVAPTTMHGRIYRRQRLHRGARDAGAADETRWSNERVTGPRNKRN